MTEEERFEKLYHSFWFWVKIFIYSFMWFIAVSQCATSYEGALSISTMGTASYVSSNNGKSWDLTSKNDSYFTVFEYDAKYSFYKHTAEDITSMYLIKKGTLNLDTATMCLTYQCQSDVGNNYMSDVWLNDTKDRPAMVISRWADGDAMYMVVWYIKSWWINRGEE